MSRITTRYVGVAFYRSTDNETLQSSVAQVFNEHGEDVIVRGAQASQSTTTASPISQAPTRRTC